MLLPEPLVKSDPLSSDDSVNKLDINFPDNADRLDQFPRWKFFTPALLYLFGRFEDIHLANFQYTIDREVKFGLARFTHPVFRGLEDRGGNPGWNHTLWAVEADLWPAFESYMLSVVISESGRRRLYRTGAQDGVICDPLHCDRHPLGVLTPVLAEVVVFGVDGNMAAAAMAFPVDVRFRLPQRVILPPRDRTRQMSSALYGEQLPLFDVMDIMVPAPEATQPIRFRARDIDSLPEAKRQEYLDAANEYRKI